MADLDTTLSLSQKDMTRPLQNCPLKSKTALVIVDAHSLHSYNKYKDNEKNTSIHITQHR